jgi:hypothetical protein
MFGAAPIEKVARSKVRKRLESTIRNLEHP